MDIFKALENNDFIKLQILLQSNDIDKVDSGGDTLLTISASDGNLYAVRWLVEFGADVYVVNSAGNSPLMCALMFRHSDCARFLRCNMTYYPGVKKYLYHAVMCDNIDDIIQDILQYEDINEINGCVSETALHRVIRDEKTDMVIKLINSGANLHIPDIFGITPKQLLEGVGVP